MLMSATKLLSVYGLCLSFIEIFM